MRAPKLDYSIFEVGTPVLVDWGRGYGPGLCAIKTCIIEEDGRIQYDKDRGLYVEFSIVRIRIVFDYPLHTNKDIEPKWTLEEPLGPSIKAGGRRWWIMNKTLVQGRMLMELSPRLEANEG